MIISIYFPADIFRYSLLFCQFKGPFRITELYNKSVKHEHLDGTPFATRSIRDLFPYTREFDELYEAADILGPLLTKN